MCDWGIQIQQFKIKIKIAFVLDTAETKNILSDHHTLNFVIINLKTFNFVNITIKTWIELSCNVTHTVTANRNAHNMCW